MNDGRECGCSIHPGERAKEELIAVWKSSLQHDGGSEWMMEGVKERGRGTTKQTEIVENQHGVL